MTDTLDRLRNHAAGLKAKPRAFRVAQEGYGQAKLWTQEESIARMEADKEAKAAEAERIEREKEEKQRKKEEKEKEKEMEAQNVARLAKKLEAERAKEAKKLEPQRVKEAKKLEQQRVKELKAKLKARRDAAAANKPTKRTRKN
ncbi:hypothetical protein CF319_g7995 [Tilletia indica]|nr:hypothetical protein CF319_g7995 [Tilletia indica]